MNEMKARADAFARALRLLEEAAEAGAARRDAEVIEAFRRAFKAAWECIIYHMHFTVLDELGDASSTIYGAYVDALITDEQGWRDMFFDSDEAIRAMSGESAHISAACVRERYVPMLKEFERALEMRMDA